MIISVIVVLISGSNIDVKGIISESHARLARRTKYYSFSLFSEAVNDYDEILGFYAKAAVYTNSLFIHLSPFEMISDNITDNSSVNPLPLIIGNTNEEDSNFANNFANNLVMDLMKKEYDLREFAPLLLKLLGISTPNTMICQDLATEILKN